MSKSLHQALSAAVLRILRPLVAVLLRHGMAYGTFAELARKAYVEEGFAHAEASGKRPTVSGVSALTGLTRKETKRLRELDFIDDQSSSRRYSRAIRVISGWTNDPRFQSSAGEPAILPMDGTGGSFSALVKEYSGDIPPAAMLSVLQDSGTVAVGEQGVVLQEKAYIPSATPLEKINILGSDVAELIDTIGHNLGAEPGERYFQRKVSNVLLHPDAVPAFRELSTRKSQLLLEEYHSWLSNHEVDPDGEPAVEPCYVAVGIYYSDYPGTGEELP
jgi:Family of unknown function (DUF6502)